MSGAKTIDYTRPAEVLWVRVRQAADAERITEVSKSSPLSMRQSGFLSRTERKAFPMHDRHGNSALRGRRDRRLVRSSGFSGIRRATVPSTLTSVRHRFLFQTRDGGSLRDHAGRPRHLDSDLRCHGGDGLDHDVDMNRMSLPDAERMMDVLNSADGPDMLALGP